MSGRDRPGRIASVEDADESGNVIEESRRYAASTVAPSPSKETPNTSRARKERSRRESSSPVTGAIEDSDSTLHPRTNSLRKSTKDREKSSSGHKKTIVAAMRPPGAKHSKTAPAAPRQGRDLEAAYYGVSPAVTSTTSRPRQTRPASYYAPDPSRPPPANARYYGQSPSNPLPTSFPPASWAGAGGVPYPIPPPSPGPTITQPPPQEYFSRSLSDRFADRFSGPRPQSALGFRAPRAAIEYDDFEPENDRPLVRRPSHQRRASRHEADDRRAMPPPPRPASARPMTLAYRPPPSTPARRRPTYDDDEFTDNPLFQDISPHTNYDFATKPIPIRSKSRRRQSISYNGNGDFQTEIAGRSSRRNSYYGGHSHSSGSAYEDKLRQASTYQDDVTGGPTLPLTAESLRRAGRNGGSSRSSGSHDESDYRQSATTGTTRLSGEEDVTIRVKGGAALKIGGAEVQCADGAEINILRGGMSFRGGSDRSSYFDQDDRRTRIERPATRTRVGSQARSYSRHPSYDVGGGGATLYDPGYYDEIPPYPPYPLQPQDGGGYL